VYLAFDFFPGFLYAKTQAERTTMPFGCGGKGNERFLYRPAHGGRYSYGLKIIDEAAGGGLWP
jgi:hypothetical protein